MSQKLEGIYFFSFHINSGNIRCVNDDNKHKQPNCNKHEHGQPNPGDEHKQRQRHEHKQLEQPDHQHREHSDHQQQEKEKKEKHHERIFPGAQETSSDLPTAKRKGKSDIAVEKEWLTLKRDI